MTAATDRGGGETLCRDAQQKPKRILRVARSTALIICSPLRGARVRVQYGTVPLLPYRGAARPVQAPTGGFDDPKVTK